MSEESFTSPRLLTLLAVSTMTVMAGATISPALPSIRAAFSGVENADVWVRLVLTLPALFTAVGAPLAGWLVDRAGRRVVLLSAMLLYGVSGSAGGAVSSIEALLVTRAGLGLAVGGLMTAATTLIADYFAGRRRKAVMGKQSVFMAGGGILFVILGGALSDISWRAPFGVYLAAFVLLIPAYLHLHEPDLDDDNQEPSGTPPADAPWLRIAPIFAVGFLGMAAFYMIPVQIPFYLRTLGVSSGLVVGVAIATATLMSAVVGNFYEQIQSHLGYLGTLGALLLLFGIGYVLIGFAASLPGVVMGIAVGGLGMGLLMPTLNSWLGDLAPKRIRGTVLGGLTTCFFLGQFVSPLLIQPVIDALSVGSAFFFAGLFLAVLAVGAGILAYGQRHEMERAKRR
jgi:MFS family permease